MTLDPRPRSPMPTPAATERRAALARLVLPATGLVLPTWLSLPSRAATPRRLTPAQSEGPFYPLTLPPDTDADLLRQGATVYRQGQPCSLSGVVTDTGGVPLAGAVVEIWQCDADGHYRHPCDGDRADPAFQAFGRAVADAEGRYRFRTIRPVAYGGRTPHIHVKLRRGQRTLLTTQLYVEGDPGNARDVLWRGLRDPLDRAAITVPFLPAPDGLQARFDLVVAA